MPLVRFLIDRFSVFAAATMNMVRMMRPGIGRVGTVAGHVVPMAKQLTVTCGLEEVANVTLTWGLRKPMEEA